MNKPAIVAAAVLLVALLGLPRVVGSMTEAAVRARVADIDADPRASAELRSFERGWFRSTARLELSVVPESVAQTAAAAGTPLGMFGALPIVVEFAHGPIAILDGVSFGWSKMRVQPDLEAPGVSELTQTLGVPYLFEFRGRSAYSGSLSFDADAPPFDLPIDAALVTFAGGTLEGSFDEPRLAADARIGSVAFTSPTGTFAVRGVEVSFDNELRSAYVMLGEAGLSIESVSIAGPAQGSAPLFEAEAVEIRSGVEADASGELLEMRIDYGFDTVRLEEHEITAATLGVAIRNVDAAAFEAYAAVAADAAESLDPEAALTALGPHLERALRAGPSLELNPIQFRYDGEPFEGRVAIDAIPERLPQAGARGIDSIVAMLGLVDSNAEVRLSKALAGALATLAARLQLAADESIPPDQIDYLAEAQSGLMLTRLIGLGILLEDGDDYRAAFDYTNGRLTLNDAALPFGLP